MSTRTLFDTRPIGLIDGEQRKLAAHSLHEARREVYLLRLRRALLTALLDRGVATMDDARAVVTLPAGVDPVCCGAAPGAMARVGLIRADGMTRTCRAIAHARPLTRWVLVDRVRAEQWLLAHPDRPDAHKGGPQ